MTRHATVSPQHKFFPTTYWFSEEQSKAIFGFNKQCSSHPRMHGHNENMEGGKRKQQITNLRKDKAAEKEVVQKR